MSTKSKSTRNVLVVSNETSKDHIKLDYTTLRRAVLTLRALNHPLRKQILSLIDSKKEIPVTAIYEKLKLEQSVASQHLAILRKANIVVTSRDGKFIYYSVNRKRLAQINHLVGELAG